MGKKAQKKMRAVFVNEEQIISLAELCRGSALPAEQVISMIEYGIVEPLQPARKSTRWQFTPGCVRRLQTATRLQHDLDVNLAGAALALDLLDEVKTLRQMVTALRRE